MRTDEIAAADRDDAEKEEDEDITQTPVAVGILAQGIVHGGPDGSPAEGDENQRQGREKGAEGAVYHQQAEDAAEARYHGDQALHLRDGHLAVLDGIMDALALVRIHAVQGIAQLVGEIGQDLEADGRQQQPDDGQRLQAVIGRGEEDAQDDAGQGQGEGTQPHGAGDGTEGHEL